MPGNDTHPILDMLQSFDLRDLVLAFCLSMVVGLLLGALVYMLLTWMSRHRRASASITRRPPRPSRSTPRSSSSRPHPGFQRSSSGYDRRSNNSLASAAFSFHRQGSSPDPLGRKSSFRASTFHPLLQVSQLARESEEASQATLPRPPPYSALPQPRPTSASPAQTPSGGTVV